MQEIITFIMEIIGTIAFAASGAMVGVGRRMDIFGVCVLGAGGISFLSCAGGNCGMYSHYPGVGRNRKVYVSFCDLCGNQLSGAGRTFYFSEEEYSG